MLPSSTDLKYFIEVAETLNLSRASERLSISQPALSFSIKRLENILGTSLLLRSKTGVKLTRSGERLYQNSKNFLSDWERIRNDALSLETEISGNYKIGAHPSVAMYALPAIVPKVLFKYPNLEFTFIHDLSRKITESIISFRIEVGIVVNPSLHPDLVIREVGRDKVQIYLHKENLVKKNRKIECLIIDPELIQTQSLMKKIKSSFFQVKKIIVSSNLEVIGELTSSHPEFACILPGRVASRYKKLIPIEDSPVYIDRHCLAYRGEFIRSASSRLLVREFEGFLKQFFQSQC